LKKKKNPPIVSKTKQDPYIDKTYMRYYWSGWSDFTIVLILQKEKVTKTSQIPIKRGC
jgi:hypothetical protein